MLYAVNEIYTIDLFFEKEIISNNEKGKIIILSASR
jgi:hypothetical protein